MESRAVAQTFSQHVVVTVLLGLHAVLLCYSAARHSPVNGEPPAIASGVYAWTEGRFHLFRVNPPLSRMIATMPLLAVRPKTNWEAAFDEVARRPEFYVGADFVRANAKQFLTHLLWARLCLVPVSVIGGWACWRWATLLYSEEAGFLALALWSFSPNILANGALATADMSGTVSGLLVCYVFWRWLEQPSWLRGIAAGLTLGIALLSKLTNLYLPPYLAAVGAMQIIGGCPRNPGRDRKVTTTQLISLFVIAAFVLHAGYGFRHALVPIKCFRFTSRLLTGKETISHARFPEGGNRFADTWLAELPCPVPADYLIGIDLQRHDFEMEVPSYLRGEWQSPGWWWYYLYAGLVKVPIGSLLLLAWTLLATIRTTACSRRLRCELFLIVPALIIVVLASSQTGMNRHFRYILPAFPFVFVWIGKIATYVSSISCGAARPLVLWTLVSAVICESLFSYPHSGSFFNSFVTSRKGGAHLGDSNIDWGQDLLFLQRWLSDHPDSRPLYIIDFAFYPIAALGIGIDRSSVMGRDDCPESRLTEPYPGWYAVSVCQLYDYRNKYFYFLHLRPVASIGYSIYIYQITLDDANRLRRQLGLVELPDDWQQEENREAIGPPVYNSTSDSQTGDAAAS